MYRAILDLSVYVFRHWDNPIILFMTGCFCVCLTVSLVRWMR